MIYNQKEAIISTRSIRYYKVLQIFKEEVTTKQTKSAKELMLGKWCHDMEEIMNRRFAMESKKLKKTVFSEIRDHRKKQNISKKKWQLNSEDEK